MRYRRHSVAFKRAVVELSLQAGVSVAALAREHGINANQVFSWRKAYREGELVEVETALLAVSVRPEPEASGAALESNPEGGEGEVSGLIEIEVKGARLRLHGRVEAETLRLVLACLAR